MSLQFIVLALVLMNGVELLHSKPCNVKILNKWPNNGYKAAVFIKVSMNYRLLRISMFFNSAPRRVENLYIRGGRIKESTLSGKRMTILFRPHQRIRKGSTVKIVFLVRHSAKTPVLTEVRFWRKPVCSAIKLPVTTLRPQRSTTAKPEPATKEPEITSKQEGPTTPSPSCTSEFDYGQVLNLSLLFYEAQRSGKLPASNRIPYRRDSAINDGQDVGKDLSGGYYDAGDFVKFNFPMAFTITILSWGVIQYEDAYRATGQYNNVLDAIKWGTDYFIKCHTARFELYGQVGDGDIDHAYWGRPEEMTMKRPSFKIDAKNPGSDLAGETAAALAAASLVFSSMPSYSRKLLSHAKELYEFADKFRGLYSDSIPNVAKFYKSWNGFNDELTWAAAWLYRASREAKYLTAAKSFYTQFGMNSNPQEFSWDDKKAGVQVLMSQITGKSFYKSNVETFCTSMTVKKRTPRGLVFISEWGANRHAANVAFICLLAADLGIKQAEYRSFARSQIHYMLGKPRSRRSFVVGFGRNPPQRPHHSSSSCPRVPAVCDWNNFKSPAPNPQILYGALVGGPDKYDGYVDIRSDYVKNEVACDYNAGFQSAIAALRHLQNNGDC